MKAKNLFDLFKEFLRREPLTFNADRPPTVSSPSP